MVQATTRARRGVSLRALGAALALGAAAASCSTMPDRRPEAGDLPSAWRDAPAGAETGGLINWWAGFDDPTLNELIAEGLSAGPTIQLARERVREARALSRTQVTRYLPQLTATGAGQYTRAVEGPELTNVAGGADTEQWIASAGGAVSWEVPLFAEAEAAARGARAVARAAYADERAAQVALAADIAQAYVDLRAAQASRAALEESIVAADRLAAILDISAEAGFAARADADDARRQAESTRARLPGFQIEARRAESVLSVLRGYAPGADRDAVLAALSAPGPVPSLPITQAPAAPADLVRLRPDIAAAEQQALQAASALALARADFLPSLNLTGAINVTDNVVGRAIGPGFTRVTAEPLISIPLFDWGQRIATARQRDAQFEQALIQYRLTVLQGVQEATQALVSLDQGARALQSARIAEEAAESALRGRRAAYDAGLFSLADLLRAEQQTIDARLIRIDSEAAQARAGIAVYRAFGGGPPLTRR